MRVITLLTDFGLRDPYVAELKAAILAISRDVHLVDLTHDVGPQDVAEAALALESAAPHFPAGTIHVAVVDPGVGTARRGLVIEARGQYFVGPDNGLFTAFVDGADWRAFELAEPRFRRSAVSATFHGRDVFGPAAAHLARGVPASRFGPPVADPIRLRPDATARARDRVEGVVVHVDRFGNLVTSIRAEHVGGLGGAPRIRIGRRSLALVTTYGDLARGGAGGLVGSQGRLEIAVRDGNAAESLGAGRGTPVVVMRAARSRRKSSRRKGSRRMP
jgi:S-adenosyl-L-methionine hydrolase (adenosine-forming)